MKVAIFGGSFDPPHVAHVLVVAHALTMGDFDEVRVVPTFKHPFAKPLTPFEHRVTMCELAMRSFRNVEVSTIEADLDRPGEPSYTVHTLEALAARNPTWQMRLVMGADLVAETPRWHAFERIEKIAPPFVVGRAGYSDDDKAMQVVLPRVASSEIRRRLRERESIVEYVPLSVREYIRAHQLYWQEREPEPTT